VGADVKELSVITGAGNHSGKEGPKIKPAVEKYFQEHSMTYRHEKNGELVLTL
jgi:DNA-nicking Smr family endonuclease